MSVISGSEYVEIATDFANAREQILAAKEFFFNAVYTIVQFNEIRPEVDLLVPFWNTYQINVGPLTNSTLFLSAIRSINQHVLIEGGFANVDAFLSSEGVTVPQAWADLCSDAGYSISSSNID